MPKVTPVFDGEVVHVMPEKCATCIFRPGNLMHLRPGRVKEMTMDTDKDEGHVVCHKTLDQKCGAICRGSYERRPSRWVQIAERLGYVRFDEGTQWP